jgi:hypothetical protein
MRNQMLVISVIGLSLTCTAWADDLPRGVKTLNERAQANTP